MTILLMRRSEHRTRWPARIASFAAALLLLGHASGGVAAGDAANAQVVEQTPAAHEPRNTRAVPPTAAGTVDISDPVIRKAIADSKDPMDDIVSVAPAAFGSGRMTPRQRIDRAFEEADLPSCLTPDAFKFVPPQIGPFQVSGLLALPFWAQAIATGKCRH